MASKNPFGQLQVRRDEEDEEVTQVPVQSTTTAPLFNTSTQADKKKKKVRPEEKKKLEENYTVQEDTEEGFEVVGKKANPRRGGNTTGTPEEKVKKPHLKNKGAYADRNNKVPTGKRQFERHSGTGRGREIAKNGAGGKHTWGTNPKNIARRGDEDYNEDENVFNYVLNAKPREEQKREEKEAVVEETPVVEAPREEVVAEVVEKAEQTQEENTFDRRKKRKGAPVEENKEDLLARPENALSLNEYMQRLKEKNQALPESRPKATPQVENSDLKPQTKEDDLTIGIAASQKKQRVKKEKKTEEKSLDVVFSTGEDYVRNDTRDNRTNGKKKGPKFTFKSEDFPEL